MLPTPCALFLPGCPSASSESPPVSPAVLPRRRSRRAPLSLLQACEPRPLDVLEQRLGCVQQVLFEAQQESLKQLAQQEEARDVENWGAKPRARRSEPRSRAESATASPAAVGPSPQQLADALRQAEEAREAAASAAAERDELAALLVTAQLRLSSARETNQEPPPSPTPAPPPADAPTEEEFRSVQSELLRLERRRSREALRECAELRASLARADSLLRELRTARAEAPWPPLLLPPLRPPPESAFAARALQRSQRLLHPPPV
jgi:hypothetical protein